MRKHLGEMKVQDNISKVVMFPERIDKLILNFKKYTIVIGNGCVKDLSITGKDTLILECLFNADLYNAYVNENKILSITEKGVYLSPKDRNIEFTYETSYKNYKIKSAFGSRVSGSCWTYVLEKVNK